MGNLLKPQEKETQDLIEIAQVTSKFFQGGREIVRKNLQVLRSSREGKDVRQGRSLRTCRPLALHRKAIVGHEGIAGRA